MSEAISSMFETETAIEAIAPLIKLIKSREELFFDLFYFVNTHFECSSNDLDNTIFQGFLRTQQLKNDQQHHREQALIQSTVEEQPVELTLDDRTSK